MLAVKVCCWDQMGLYKIRAVVTGPDLTCDSDLNVKDKNNKIRRDGTRVYLIEFNWIG